MNITPESGNSTFIVVDNLFQPEKCFVVNQTRDENFTWTRNTSLLLTSEYLKRNHHFRNPKIKKKGLWAEIRHEFAAQGYVVTDELLDRKWRNMKKTYTTIKDNSKKTGRGRITWEYFEIFEEIYQEDSTMNLPKTISSTIVASEAAETSLNVVSLPEIPVNVMSPENCQISAEERNSPVTDLPSWSCSSKDFEVEETATPNSSKIRNRTLYNFRKKQLDVEERRIKEIEMLRKAVEVNNKIQQERNDLLKSLLQSKYNDNQ